MRFDEDEQRLVFEILCKHGSSIAETVFTDSGIQKVYKLPLEDCDAVQAVYTKGDQNRIVSLPKKLIEAINNFHNQLDEVSMIASKDQFKLKSYIDDAKGNSCCVM